MKRTETLRTVPRLAVLTRFATRVAIVLAGWLLVEALVAAAPQAPPRDPTAPRVAAVDAIGMTVDDMDRSVEFYAKVLSFEKVSDVEVAGAAYEHLLGVFGVRIRVVRMRLGDELIELTDYLAPAGRRIPVDSQSNDYWFQHVAIIVRDMDEAYAWLRNHKVQHVSSGPQRLPDWNKSAGGIRAFYFKDPDGHPLEILQFPEGKGHPKWHLAADRLFLGIDHTAIVVSDTATSLRFYRDMLGLTVVGASENYGTEQEHLNSVFGARLQITALKAARGPGVEFLEYLAPRNGRPRPVESRANDLLHWETTVTVQSTEAIFSRLRSTETVFVSPGPVRLGGEELGFGTALLVRDPDGHAVKIIEK